MIRLHEQTENNFGGRTKGKKQTWGKYTGDENCLSMDVIMICIIQCSIETILPYIQNDLIMPKFKGHFDRILYSKYRCTNTCTFNL